VVNVGWKYLAVGSSSALGIVLAVILWAVNSPAPITRTVLKDTVAKPPAEVKQRKGERWQEFVSGWMPLDGYRPIAGETVEWSAKVVMEGLQPRFVLSLRMNGMMAWQGDAKKGAIIIGDDRRADLACKLTDDETPGKLSTLAECRGPFMDVLVPARAENPRLVFGATIYDLGPQGAAMCKELAIQAGRAYYRMDGTDDAKAKGYIDGWFK
jgi:hypothetical protein